MKVSKQLLEGCGITFLEGALDEDCDITIVKVPSYSYEWSFEFRGVEYSGTVKFSKDERGPVDVEWDISPPDDVWEELEERIIDSINQ